MRLALDSNRYCDLVAGDEELTHLIEDAQAVYLPFIVIGELRAGFALGHRQTENERMLREFLLRDGIENLFADEQTTFHYAAVYKQLRKQGTPIPTNDMWIAAMVLQHELGLCSRDQHFDQLAQIPRV